MTGTNTDILGERSALEKTIDALQQQIDVSGDDADEDMLCDVDHGITIAQARERVACLNNILAKYRLLEKAAEQFKNPPKISANDRRRMISSAQMIRSVREILTNVTLAEPSAIAINRGALLILDSAVEELERID